MRLEIPYEEALKRHPIQVAETMKMLGKSKSRDKDVDPTHYIWVYDWGVWGKACSLADILSGNVQEETRTMEERICGISLFATKGRKYGASDTPILPVPQEVLEACTPKPTPELPEYPKIDLEHLPKGMMVLFTPKSISG